MKQRTPDTIFAGHDTGVMSPLLHMHGDQAAGSHGLALGLLAR